MHHLIGTEGHPIGFGIQIIKASQIPRTGLDSIHYKMDEKIHHAEPPNRGVHIEDDGQGGKSVNSRVNGKGHNKVPVGAALAKHVNILEDKVCQKMLYLEKNEECKDPLNCVWNHE